jgi:E3 ubiquitin-protein ligase SHPRH
MDEANELIEGVLNGQTDLLWEWRTRLITLLTQRLSTESDDVDGEEYSRTLDTQGEADTFLQAYSALVSDRRQGLYNRSNILKNY